MLRVFLITNNSQRASRLRDEAETIIGVRAEKKEFHMVPWTDSSMLSQCIRMTGSGLLVLSDCNEAVSPETVYRLIDEIDYPVLLVRSPG